MLTASRSATLAGMGTHEADTDLVDTGEAGPVDADPGGFEWRRGRYHVSTDPARLDVEGTAAFLGTTYWAQGRTESVIRRSIEGSIAFGVYDGDQQVGFARAVTDRATFAWVCDVFIRDSHQGRGLGIWLMRCVLAHPELRDLRRWLLASTSARGLYARLGFTPLPAPERFMQIDTRPSAGAAMTPRSDPAG
jgi:GNAT superfamily N-acetyltransferase